MVKELKLIGLKTERRKFKRHKVNRRPIAVLGPDPVRVGHLTVISDESAEIEFSESNGKAVNKFSELVVLVPDFNSPFLSGKINVKTVSCNTASTNGSRLQSRMRTCVISIDMLNSIRKRQLINACL